MCLLYDIYLLLLSNRNIGPTTVRFWTIRIYYANLSSLTPETPALRHWSCHYFNLSPLIILVTLNMRINPEVELRLYSSASFVIRWCDMSIIFNLMNLIYYILSLSKCRIIPYFLRQIFIFNLLIPLFYWTAFILILSVILALRKIQGFRVWEKNTVNSLSIYADWKTMNT